MTLLKVTTQRLEMAYRDSGSGFPVLFIHGWPENSLCWEPALKHIDFPGRFIRPDLRGLGESSREGKVEQFAKRELARDVLSLMDSLGIESFAAVGHDWGGAVVQELTFLAPDRVKSLSVLNFPLINNPVGMKAGKDALASSPFNFLWYQGFQQTPGLAERMIPGNEEVWVRTFYPNAPAHMEELVLNYIEAYKKPNTVTSTANYYRAMAIDGPNWAQLFGKPLNLPTQFIFGIKDPVVVPEYLTGYEKVFPQAEVSKLNAGHFVQEELPQEVGQLLSRHFKKFHKA